MSLFTGKPGEGLTFVSGYWASGLKEPLEGLLRVLSDRKKTPVRLNFYCVRPKKTRNPTDLNSNLKKNENILLAGNEAGVFLSGKVQITYLLESVCRKRDYIKIVKVWLCMTNKYFQLLLNSNMSTMKCIKGYSFLCSWERKYKNHKSTVMVMLIVRMTAEHK